MRGDVEMIDPASSNLHDYKDIEQSKIGCDDHEEVTCENDLSMVSHESTPTLRWDATPRSRTLGHVASDRPRRDSDAEFQ
jgi:hypothetical protein